MVSEQGGFLRIRININNIIAVTQCNSSIAIIFGKYLHFINMYINNKSLETTGADQTNGIFPSSPTDESNNH